MLKFYFSAAILLSNFIIAQAQHSTPETAQIIQPSGYYLCEVKNGKGISGRYDSVTVNDTSAFQFANGFTSWFTFKAKDEQPIAFTIHPMASPTPIGTRRVDRHYMDFLVYQFDGTGAQLSAAIQSHKIFPIRVALEWNLDKFNCIGDGGLSPFATDTIASDPWQDGFLKPIRAKAGEQFFVVVQAVLCDHCTLLIDGHFSICFSDKCAPPVLALRNLNFDPGKSQLDGASPALDQIAGMLKTDSTLHLMIKGYTDNTGTEADNLQLSINRAKAVYDYLVADGVRTKQLSFSGYGSANALVPNDSDEHKRLNRRVEFTFEKKKSVNKK